MEPSEARSQARSLRAGVFADNNNECFACGFGCAPILIMHHILPVSVGGDNGQGNLAALCPNCHVAVHKLAGSHSREVQTNPDLDPLCFSVEFRAIYEWVAGLNSQRADAIARLATYQQLDKDTPLEGAHEQQ